MMRLAEPSAACPMFPASKAAAVSAPTRLRRVIDMAGFLSSMIVLVHLAPGPVRPATVCLDEEYRAAGCTVLASFTGRTPASAATNLGLTFQPDHLLRA